MNERDFGDAVRRYLDGFGPYDARSVQPALAEPPPRRGWPRSLLASAGACLAVAAVVGILVGPRWAAALRSTTTPAAHPTAAAGTAPATPAASAPPALLVQDHGWTRLDWSGR